MLSNVHVGGGGGSLMNVCSVMSMWEGEGGAYKITCMLSNVHVGGGGGSLMNR